MVEDRKWKVGGLGLKEEIVRTWGRRDLVDSRIFHFRPVCSGVVTGHCASDAVNVALSESV